MRFGRNVLILACAAAAVTPLVAAVPQATAASSRPSFTTKLLAGSSGSSEPRVAVAPDGTRYIDTNATDGTEGVYSSANGLAWARTAGTPPKQILPTTDVDVLTPRTGRFIATELDLPPPISFKTAYSDAA